MEIGSEWEGGSQQGISFVCINSFISHTTSLPPNPIDMTGIKKFVFELKGNWCVNRLKWEWKWKKFFIFFSPLYTSFIYWVDERKRVERKILNVWKNFQEYLPIVWPWYGGFILLLLFFYIWGGSEKTLRKEKAHENLKSCCKKDIIMKTIQAWTIGLWKDEKLIWVKIMTFKLFKILNDEESGRK